MAFGYPFGFLAAGEDLCKYISSLGPLMPFLEPQGIPTWIARILNNEFVKKLMTPTANDGSGMGHMIGVAKQAVAERHRPGAEPKEDMLGSFMNHGLSQVQAESKSLLRAMAGADSTATAARVIMCFIMMNPLVYKSCELS